jgi:CrcB protein
MILSSLAVGIGGFVGAILRFLISTAMVVNLGPAWTLLGTLTVNIVGSLLIGLLSGLGGVFENNSLNNLRLFLTTGILGGFTTFSTFSMETVSLIRRGEMALAGGNILANLLGALIATLVGIYLGKQLAI